MLQSRLGIGMVRRTRRWLDTRALPSKGRWFESFHSVERGATPKKWLGAVILSLISSWLSDYRSLPVCGGDFVRFCSSIDIYLKLNTRIRASIQLR